MEEKNDNKIIIVLGYILAGIISPILFIISLIKIFKEKDDVNSIKESVLMLIISIVMIIAEVFGGLWLIDKYDLFDKDNKVVNNDVNETNKVKKSGAVINFYKNTTAGEHSLYYSEYSENGESNNGVVSSYQCTNKNECQFILGSSEHDYVVISDGNDVVIYNVKTGNEYLANNFDYVKAEKFDPYEVDGKVVGFKYTTDENDNYYDFTNQKVVYTSESTAFEIVKCIPEIAKRHIVAFVSSDNISDVVVIDIDTKKEVFRTDSNIVITNDKVVYYSEGYAAADIYCDALYDGNYNKVFDNTARSLSYYLDDDGTLLYVDGESIVTMNNKYKETKRTKIDGLSKILDKDTSVAYRNGKSYVVSNSDGKIIKEYKEPDIVA